MTDEPAGRTHQRAVRTDATLRRDLILDAAVQVLAEGDPLLVTFDEVARAAAVSRALVYRHVTDRRGLHDAVQVRVIGRLGDWVGHGLARADTPVTSLRAIVFGLWSFVETDPDAWRVLAVTGGFDHPSFHSLRARWVARLAPEAAETETLRAQVVIAGLVSSAGSWVGRGVEPGEINEALRTVLTGSDPDLD